MDVGRFDEFRDYPLCRFGPGGDYVRNWPAKTTNPPTANSSNPLRKILNTIADIIGATIDPNMLSDMTVEGPADCTSPVIINDSREEKRDAADNPEHTDHPQAVGNTQTHSEVQPQPMLFSDDRRTRTSRRRKSNHRIRAYRKPQKKKTPHKIEGQGTLFEIDGIGQSAA